MGVEGLFQNAPVLRWSYDDKRAVWSAQGLRGVTARVWISAVSGKWVLTVEMPGGITRTRRVAGIEQARPMAEQWLREEGHG